MARNCPACAADNPADAWFCARCGTSLPEACPRCGANVARDARFCPACGQAMGGVPAPEERKVATVVFVDLVDSTALADQLDPERFRSIQQAYFARAAAAVERAGGVVEKFIGDAVVAVFGVPRVHEDDAVRGVAAALEIVAEVERLNDELEPLHGVRLAVRVAVNTGDVVAPTEVRPDRAMVTGDAVNVAARLQAAAAPGTILVGERTFQAARGAFQFSEPRDIAVKGKRGPLPVREVLGRSELQPDAVRPGWATRGSLQSAMIGRDHEASLVGGLVDEAIEAGRPRLAEIYGPAGIGKSRLVREVVATAVAQHPDIVTLRGRCPAVGQGLTLWPLAEIVRAACGIALDDAVGVAEAALEGRGRDLLVASGLAGEEIDATINALATTAGIVLPDNPLDRMRPSAVAIELGRAWPRFISAIAARRSAILVIEDLHWASDQLVEVLERVVARAVGPILIVVTARPEFAETRPGFASGTDGVTPITLRPLGPAHSRALLAGLLRADGLPSALEQTIVATADGNPLFIEEILTRLIEAGSLASEDGLWRATGGAATIEIPDTIQAVLAARIDSLPSDQKRILQEASVVGRIFWERPVELAIGSSDVGVGLTGLEGRGLVALRLTSSLSGQSEYAFKHALVRDVAYASLPVARRARAHAAVGRWLSELSPDRPDELAELVAFHYAAAVGEGSDLAWSNDPDEARDVRGRAFSALMAGGTAARRRSGLALALSLHETAARLAETDVDRARAEEEIGDDHDAGYHGEQAVPAWDRALELWRSLPDSSGRIAQLCYKAAYMGAVRWGGFRSPMDPAVIDRYVDDGLAAVDDEELEARLQVLRGASANRWAAFHRSDPLPLADRLAAIEIGRSYAERANLPSLEAVALDTVAPLLMISGDLAGALEAKRRQVAVAARIEGIRERQFELFEAADALVWIAGEAGPMLEPLLVAHRLGQDLSPHELLHSTFGVMAALFHLGRWDELLGYLDEHLRTFALDDQSVCPFRPGGLALGAIVLADRGDRDGAVSLLAQIPETDAPVGLVDGLRAMAENAIGDPAAARITAERVLASGDRNFAEEPAVEIVAMLDALAELGDRDGLARFLPEARRRSGQVALIGPSADRAEARAAAAAGDLSQARDLLERALEGFETLSVFEAARTRERLAALDGDAAIDLLSQSLAAYESLGAEPHAARARDALAEAAGRPVPRT